VKRQAGETDGTGLSPLSFFLSISKPPKVSDATKALPTRQMFLKWVKRRLTAERCAQQTAQLASYLVTTVPKHSAIAQKEA